MPSFTVVSIFKSCAMTESLISSGINCSSLAFGYIMCSWFFFVFVTLLMKVKNVESYGIIPLKISLRVCFCWLDGLLVLWVNLNGKSGVFSTPFSSFPDHVCWTAKFALTPGCFWMSWSLKDGLPRWQKFVFIFISCVWVFCLCICLCTTHVLWDVVVNHCGYC